MNYSSEKTAFKNVIINADDYGITKGVNRAIEKLIDAGIVTSTSVMSNMPYLANIHNLKDSVGFGVHFNLTIGKPIGAPDSIPSIVNERGEFNNFSTLMRNMKRGILSKKEVENEFQLQVGAIIEKGIMPDHVDSHQSLLKYPFFERIIRKIANKYRISAVRTYRPLKFDYTRLLSIKKVLKSIYLSYQRIKWKNDGFSVVDKYDSLLKFGLNFNDALQRLHEMFNRMSSGIYEIAVHPGYCNDNRDNLGAYVCEREIELEALLSIEFRKILESSKPRLIRFADIAENINTEQRTI
ncbi:MAG TPA: ChbG/HpnK family deacetylase [Candidatus Pacearchaeota archaeon]|nr:ChbG/HpnK family deacetylase [Candidatus Pacearchaeota archaeon]